MTLNLKNGHSITVVTVLNKRNYKGHTIHKVSRRGIESYIVDEDARKTFWYLKNAKNAIDAM